MRRTRWSTVAVIAVAITALTSCGSDAPAGSDAGGDGSGLTTVKVGIVPVSTVAPLYLGIEQGFFEDVGLEVVPEVINTSPAIVAGVISNEQQIGFSAVASILQAQARGLPISVVVGGSMTPKSEPATGLIAAKDSGLTSPAQLAGKTIAVNELQGQSELAIRAVAKEAGVSQDDLEFIALPFPDMVAALDAGQADAAGMVQPFGTVAEAAGHVTIVPDYYMELDEALTITSWLAADSFISENEDVVRNFSEALSKSMQYAIDNPAEVRRIIPTFTRIPAEAAEGLPLAATSPTVTQDALEKEIELMVEFGLLESAVDADEYVAELVRDDIVK